MNDLILFLNTTYPFQQTWYYKPLWPEGSALFCGDNRLELEDSQINDIMSHGTDFNLAMECCCPFLKKFVHKVIHDNSFVEIDFNEGLV